MVTHPIFNLITQGLNSVNRLQSASPFGASRATLDLLLVLPTFHSDLSKAPSRFKVWADEKHA